MNILFLSSWQPFPPSNGSEQRIFHLVTELSIRHQVTLLCLRKEGDDNLAPEPIEGIRMHTALRREYQPRSIRALGGLLGTKPRFLVDTRVPSFARLVDQELRGGKFDLVVASQLGMSDYLPSTPECPAIFEEIEVGVYRSKHHQASSALNGIRHALTWLKLKSYLRRVVPRFSAVTVVSQQEKDQLEKMLDAPTRIEIVPNGIDLSAYSQVARHENAVPTLVYAGSMSYFANYDAMCWFITEIFPRIRRERPSVRLVITGHPGEMPLPNYEGVETTGYVEDVRPIVASADVSVVPLRLGGGTRLKILEAMALEIPVVSTRKGAEGLDVLPSKHLLVEDSPDAFADAVLRLLSDDRLSHMLTEESRVLVARQYDWSRILPVFASLAEEVAAHGSSDSVR